HAGKFLAFFLLSALDLVLTWSLLRQKDGTFYEGNPLARWWLAHAGWAGLICFKVVVVLITAWLASAISTRRPRVGGLVLSFACSVVGAVVLYSAMLKEAEGRETGAIARTNQLLDTEIQSARDYLVQLRMLRADLIQGSCTLREAVEQLAR